MDITYTDFMVYLVDDDEAIRDSLTSLIKSAGLNIKSFESAETFLKNYFPDQAGCLILDVRMPVMTGLELQDALAKSSISIPIIFISGNAEIPDSAKAFRAGAVDFLEKPFDGTVLIERIHEAFNKDFKDKKQRLEKNHIEKCFANLTSREKEVLQLIISNHSNKEAAKKLGVSHRTIEAHRARIMEKMQVENIAALVMLSLNYSLFSE
ncbi:MAG: response regulator [Methylomonas sp.]|jgi:RNA polymerase sigma factor (sigma-70 family)